MILFLLLSTVTLGAAHFRETPSNHSVLLGEDVTFRCASSKSTGGYELYSQWRSNTGSLLGFSDAGQLNGHQGRYSYIKDSPEELHLRIERVSLEDDGQFECQMLLPDVGPIRSAAQLNVIVPPTGAYFTNYQTGSAIEVNEDIALNITCVVPNAKPEAHITWYINGRKIEDGVHKWNSYNLNKTVTSYASLHFRPRRNDHKKMLTCQAVHEDSSTQSRTNLTLNVLYPSDRPKVSVYGGDSYVRAGDNVTLVCLVNGGNPPPNVSWFLNDKAIGTRFVFDAESQETRNTYSFLAEPTDNKATYECRSTNRQAAQPLTNGIHVKVAYPATGVELFGDVSVRMGEITSIQCKTKPSNPPSKISWLVNGHPVPSSIQSEHQQEYGTISISNLTVNSNELMSGKHRIGVECTARNDEGSTSKQHIIKILAPPLPPRITGIDDVAHLEGEIVNMTCEAHGGNPLAEITWYRGYEKNMPKGKKKAKWSKIIGARSAVSGDSAVSTVSITLDRNMNGQRIKCEAMNAALDEPIVDFKQINVLFAPKRVAIRAPDGARHQLFAGKEARLVCTAPGSNPPSTITWQFHPEGETQPLVYTGETVLNETSRDSGFTIENAVTFTPTEVHDRTIVRCIASNPLWTTPKNTTFPLNVYYAPRLLVDSPIGIVVSEGESFRENLTVKGNPPVSQWKWRKNGDAFDHTVGNVFARGATLSGRTLKSTDAGTYTLFAVNSVGTANVTIQLTVEYGARIISISSPIISSKGETVVMECDAEGEPRKANMVTWYRFGNEISSAKQGDTRAVLRINASEETAGEYVCKADNGVGIPTEKSALLLVNSAPRLLKLPSLSRAAGSLGSRARARCRASAVPDADFIWDRSGEFIKGNSSKYGVHTIQLDYSTFESTLIIHNLTPDDFQREIRCTARNSLGTDSIKIPIGPLSPPDVPHELKVTNTSSASIAIVWTAGFDGGSDQVFEVRYQKDGEGNTWHGVNTTHTSMQLSGLTPARIYTFQLRSVNGRGFSSEMTHPPLLVSTLSEDGVDVAQINGRTVSEFFGTTGKLLLAIVVGVLLIGNFIVCCYCLHKKSQKRQKIQETTKMVRTAGNGDVRIVQMYGTMLQATGQMHHDDLIDASEDDHSVRTMIEVNPNGYLQQIDPHNYGQECLMEYDFDPRDFPASRHGTMGRGTTYANMPYPEPPQDFYADRSMTRRLLTNNNDPYNSPQHLSTFIKPQGVRPGPLNYSQLEGDLV